MRSCSAEGLLTVEQEGGERQEQLKIIGVSCLLAIREVH